MKKITLSAITILIAIFTYAQETDPQVGVNKTSFVPRWDGSALVSGAIQDNGSKIGLNRAPESTHRFSAFRQITTSGFTSAIYSAVKGENNISGSTTTNSVGYLGMNSPQNLYGVAVFPDLALTELGVLGVKENNTDPGAGLYGWNRGGASYNYAVVGRTIASGGINYGLLGSAVGSGTENTGIYGKAEGASKNYGVLGTASTAAGQTGYGVYGSCAGAGTNYAGFFNGKVNIIGGDEIVTISGVNPYIQMNSSGVAAGYLKAINSSLHLFTNAGGDVVFGTNGAKRMIITSTGRVLVNMVGAGTGQFNVAGTDEVINVNGTNPFIQMTNGTNNVGYVRANVTNMEIATNSGNVGNLVLRTNGGDRMTIGANGRVAINTIITPAQFNVQGTDETVNISGTNPYIQMTNGANNVGYVRANTTNLEIATNSGNAGNLVLRTNGADRMIVGSNGRVAINTIITPAQLNVYGTDETINIDGSNPYMQLNSGGVNIGYLRAKDANLVLATNSSNSGKIQLMTKNKSRLVVAADGRIAIGENAKFASGYLLSIQGKVIAEEMLVQLNGSWPDYVFEKEYKLMKLPELKNYIEQNNHLPDVPAARDMQSGIAVGNMNKILMQKVEELTLYILQLHEEIEKLKNKH